MVHRKGVALERSRWTRMRGAVARASASTEVTLVLWLAPVTRAPVYMYLKMRVTYAGARAGLGTRLCKP